MLAQLNNGCLGTGEICEFPPRIYHLGLGLGLGEIREIYEKIPLFSFISIINSKLISIINK